MPFVHIYPNPARDELQIDYQFSPSNKAESGHILVYNLLGKEVISIKDALNTNRHTLNISRLEGGVYHILN